MTDKEPKYTRVIEWVRNGLSSGELKLGDRLKTENELSRMFGISRQTVRRAIGELENEHLLTRIQGSGTYVGENAHMPRRESTMNIAVISTYVDSYIFPKTLRGFEKIFSRRGYTTQIAFTNNSVYRESVILKNLLQKDNIDGLIVEPSKSALPNPNLKYYREMVSRNIPILFFNSFYPELDLPCVSLDDKTVSANAAKLLIDAGHRDIAGIFKLDDGQGHLRYAGYMEAMREADIPVHDRQVIWYDSEDIKDFGVLEDYLFKRIGSCTAVECYNDELAYQLTEACKKRGIRIPEDLSVVSIDNSDMAGIASTPFTSYPHPMEELGKKGAENLLRLIENPGFRADYRFDSKPVIRDSIRKIPVKE